MKVLIKFKLVTTQIEIDLTEYGFDETESWYSLTEDEQNEILDPLRDENLPNVSIETID